MLNSSAAQLNPIGRSSRKQSRTHKINVKYVRKTADSIKSHYLHNGKCKWKKLISEQSALHHNKWSGRERGISSNVREKIELNSGICIHLFGMMTKDVNETLINSIEMIRNHSWCVWSMRMIQMTMMFVCVCVCVGGFKSICVCIFSLIQSFCIAFWCCQIFQFDWSIIIVINVFKSHFHIRAFKSMWQVELQIVQRSFL